MQSAKTGDWVADPMPIEMGQKKGITLTSFLSVKTGHV